ncbi:MAG TPA: hypothetical protein VMF61_03325 [Candidatus Acidoferrales bacterium]|nr:hypothetical protein [Candidatus Acidoferrales bacterium]
MKRRLWLTIGLPVIGTFVVGMAACSGVGAPPTSPGAMSNARVDAGSALGETSSGLLLRAPGPYNGVKPPFKAGETVTYAWTRSSTVTKWLGPTASPSTGPAATASATITDTYSVDTKTGVYTDVVDQKSSDGATSTQTMLFGFVKSGALIKQVGYYTNLVDTLGGGTGSYDSLTTYPVGATTFVFPPKTGSKWSGTADSIVSYSEAETGEYTENASSTNGADGSYTGQDQYSSAASGGGFAEQDTFNFAAPAKYVLSVPSYMVNPETWTFGAVKNKNVPVTTSGTAPLPYPTGTTQVPDWYPGGGALPKPSAVDNYEVTGSKKMPSMCGALSGKTATGVTETFWNLDPIFGSYNKGTLDYYLDGTSTTECIVYVTQQWMYANGNSWESLGAWGGPWFELNYASSQVLTKKTLAKRASARALAAMPVVPRPMADFGRPGTPSRFLVKPWPK